MPDQDLLGRRVGHIRVVEVLGEGGMGTLYVGADEKLQRRVALKAVQERRLDAESRARFLREARVLSQLHHPNICGIHDYLESDGRDFLVLELIDGRNLREVLRERLPAALQMRIARQVAGVSRSSTSAWRGTTRPRTRPPSTGGVARRSPRPTSTATTPSAGSAS